jgi:hypothetical protein
MRIMPYRFLHASTHNSQEMNLSLVVCAVVCLMLLGALARLILF